MSRGIIGPYDGESTALSRSLPTNRRSASAFRAVCFRGVDCIVASSHVHGQSRRVCRRRGGVPTHPAHSVPSIGTKAVRDQADGTLVGYGVVGRTSGDNDHCSTGPLAPALRCYSRDMFERAHDTGAVGVPDDGSTTRRSNRDDTFALRKTALPAYNGYTFSRVGDASRLSPVIGVPLMA